MILNIGKKDGAQTGDFWSKVQRSFLPIPARKSAETFTKVWKECWWQLHHRNLPNVFLALFQRNEQVHTFSTRNSKSLHYPYFSKTVTQQSIMCSGVKIWNSIPFTVRNMQSQSAFKNNLKRYLKTRFNSDYQY